MKKSSHKSREPCTYLSLLFAWIVAHGIPYRTLTTAGTDTTSNAIARTLHVLATRPEVQERVRVEVLRAQSASGGHDLEYDDLVELPYLDAVCRETLRLYVHGEITFNGWALMNALAILLYHSNSGSKRRNIVNCVTHL